LFDDFRNFGLGQRSLDGVKHHLLVRTDQRATDAQEAAVLGRLGRGLVGLQDRGLVGRALGR